MPLPDNLKDTIMPRFHNPLNRTRGFTMIEIMIVVLIIGILCSIAVPLWMGARENTYTKSCVSQLRQIQSAKEAWAIECQMDDSSVPTWDQLLQYIKTQPQCPAGGQYTIGAVVDDPICSYGNDHQID
jgi:prepilin-type N-terminal cleavage/methylation domain-containing protein